MKVAAHQCLVQQAPQSGVPCGREGQPRLSTLLDTDDVVEMAETLPVDLATAPDPASPVGVTVRDG